MANERITLQMSKVDAILALAEGNPGALTVIMQIMKREDIDPDAFMGPFGTLLLLDSHNIYGSRIWVLYKDVCGENVVNMLGLLRAVQLGILSEYTLNTAIDNYGRIRDEEKIDIDSCLEQVRERLPNFGQDVIDGQNAQVVAQ